MTNVYVTREHNLKEGLEGDLLHKKVEMSKGSLYPVPKWEGLGHSVKYFPFKYLEINLFTHLCYNYLLMA